MVEMALSEDPLFRRRLLEQATKLQSSLPESSRGDSLIDAADLIKVDLLCQGPGFGLGVIPLERLLAIFHRPLVGLTRTMETESGASKDIVKFRHRLSEIWSSAFLSLLYGGGEFKEGTGIAMFELSVEKRCKVAMGFAKGSFPEVCLVLSVVFLI